VTFPEDPDRELRRLHRRAATDMAARMRLPAWEHLSLPLAAPMGHLRVADLLRRVVEANVAFAALLLGQSPPDSPAGSPPELPTGSASVSADPVTEVIESIRTVLTVVRGLDPDQGFSPELRIRFWQRIAELTVLGHDLQQAIGSGAGVDDLLVDRLASVAPDVTVWPNLGAIAIPDDEPVDVTTAVLARHGRPRGRILVPSDNCATGTC